MLDAQRKPYGSMAVAVDAALSTLQVGGWGVVVLERGGGVIN
jgi:hypothetical protein